MFFRCADKLQSFIIADWGVNTAGKLNLSVSDQDVDEDWRQPDLACGGHAVSAWATGQSTHKTLSCMLQLGHRPLFVPVSSGRGKPPLICCPSDCCQCSVSIFSLSLCSFSQDFLTAPESWWFRLWQFFYWSRLEDEVHAFFLLSWSSLVASGSVSAPLNFSPW